ncbi:carbohydrate ABC transporter permease [Nonomuraea sp. 3N208]|uniref:carbohydrate ABC transporter permease n=1 Tax=Nonomuraea sp. 3N208 TaxID=3457421 RepID=UPI003FD2849D
MSVRLRALAGYVLAAITVAPLVWLLVSVLKPADELFQVSVPSRLTLDNLLYVLTEVPIGRYMLNSAVVSVAVTVVALVLHSMAAYALARLRFPGRQVIFSVIVSTLLVSLPVILVPLFLVARQLGLLDTYAGLILPAIFHAFGIFLLRQYYLSIPRELEEAADLDGCGYFRRWWQVVVPLSRPILASLAVLFFLANWNAFLWPLTATRDPDLRMVQVGIATLQGQYGSAWNYVLAATVVAAVPTLIAFVLGQRRLVEAIKTSGLK